MVEIYKPLSYRDQVINAIGGLLVGTVFLKRELVTKGLIKHVDANALQILDQMGCLEQAGEERVATGFKSGKERKWKKISDPRKRKSVPKSCRDAECTFASNRNPCPLYLEAGGIPIKKERKKRTVRRRHPDMMF